MYGSKHFLTSKTFSAIFDDIYSYVSQIISEISDDIPWVLFFIKISENDHVRCFDSIVLFYVLCAERLYGNFHRFAAPIIWLVLIRILSLTYITNLTALMHHHRKFTYTFISTHWFRILFHTRVGFTFLK